MNIIPEVKEIALLKGSLNAEKINWRFAEGTDRRVISAAARISEAGEGVSAFIEHGSSGSEDYSLKITQNEILISAEGAAGAFYALSTLKMLIKRSAGVLECCEIKDSPDMKYRGFYQDVTRGRIPNLETLKRLADTMADYKLNSLQLYVEHTFEFEEYSDLNDELGYLTAEEIRELDAYCKERFIALIPSLATFGHLYHLLQNDKYKHLCELKDYEPSRHYWQERMEHHTINPLLDESFELIKSLIDQHLAAFTSNYFNICGDETFDLGKDVNKEYDSGDLYVGFISKIVSYLESKGKRVMMWADVVLNRPDKLSRLSKNIIFLNWDYVKNIDTSRIAKLEDYTQFVCPGTNSWIGFCERLDIAESNIMQMAKAGKKYGAKGILNTNWGDCGNPASIEMAMYSLILGAAMGWSVDCEVNEEFRKSVSQYQFGFENAVDILFKISNASTSLSWTNFFAGFPEHSDLSQSEFEEAQRIFNLLLNEIKEAKFKTEALKNEFIIAIQGQSMLLEATAKVYGFNAPSNADFDAWLSAYTENWLRDYKKSELNEMIRVLKANFG